MGIVNLTDDSFFARSRCHDTSAAMSRIELLLEEGADIIDIGACSTRPGSVAVGAEEEWRRICPLLKELKSDFPDLRLSLDTCWSSVVMKAYDLVGDFMVNDISSGEDDAEMLAVVGNLGLQYIAMHKRGNPGNMQDLTDYEDVTKEVSDYFREFSIRAREAGVRDWILDPGFGFAKTIEQNYRLLDDLDRIAAAASEGCSGRGGRRVLVGVSRKSMIYKPLGLAPEDCLSATQAVHMAALMKGADILRVHDVKEARQSVSLYYIMNQSFIQPGSKLLR